VLCNILSGFLPEQFSEMLAADNIEGVIDVLGGEKTSNVIELINKKYEDELKLISSRLEYAQSRSDERAVTKWQEVKDKKEKELKIIKERAESVVDEGSCRICYEDFDKPVMVNCCQSMFCGKCILPWFSKKQSCPLCREKIEKKNMIYIDENVSETNNKPIKKKKQLTKLETILSIIKKNPSGRFIIFSSYDVTFSRIHHCLKNSNVSFSELKGAASTREKIINQYKRGNIRVMLLNCRHNGAGINLQETTDIILYHEMEESLHTQILGRANRIGRTTSLTVHQLTN
jgi:SNF2 family DNA or RNA helicase